MTKTKTNKNQEFTRLEKDFINDSLMNYKGLFQSTENQQKKPLDIYRDFVGRSDSYFRLLLYKMRDVSKQIMTSEERHRYYDEKKRPNIQFCGNGLSFNKEAIELVLTDKKKIAYRNLAMCGLVWRCPICSMKILQGRQEQLYKYISSHKKAKLEVGFVTLTIRHNRKDSLEYTLNKLNDNYRAFQQNRAFKKHKKQILGQVKAVEITHSPRNGWHPHLHILYFFKKTSLENINHIHDDIVTRWADFRDNNSLKRSQKAVLSYDNEIVDYMSKWDVIKEVTATHVKKSSGTTPFQMLKKLALKDYDEKKNGKLKLMGLFREYATYTKGKQRLQISPNIKKAYPEVSDKTDEDLLKDIKVEKLIATMQYIVWHQIVKKGLQPHIINVYKMSGIEAVTTLLKHRNINFDVKTKDNITQYF